MNIKPNTYYKDYFDDIKEYNIIYTGNNHVYVIARKYNNEPLYKYDHKVKLGNIKKWQNYITWYNSKIEEISEGDVFLELL